MPDDAGAAGYSFDPGPNGGRTATASHADGSGALSSFGAGGTPSSSQGGDGGAQNQATTAAASRGGAPGAGGASRGGSGGGHATAGATGVGRGGSANGGVAGAASANTGEGGAPEAMQRELYFSEYVEAGGDKALEIAALAPASLTGCVIAIYSNGSTVEHTLKLDGSVAGGGVYTLCSSKVAAKVRCDRSTNLGFDGNDAIALVCDGVTLDVIGQIGVDPGDAWLGPLAPGNAGAGGEAGNAGANGTGSTPETSTADRTLRRRCGITAGDTDGNDVFDPSVEWVPLPADTLDGLGDPTCG